MNTISQSEILLQDANNEISEFFRKFQVSNLLKQCNGYKQKGFSVIQLFTYLVALMFQPLSTYMAMRVGAYKEPFSKNTIRRFCNNTSINWHKFLRTLSQKIVSEFMRPATSEKREEFFVIDDTPFHKSGKKTELVSKFFNHVTMKYEMGYRILTLLWTDGYSNIPIDFTPLSSGNEKLIASKAKTFDGRTLAGRIRKQACMKAPDLILMMLSQAVAAGHTAKYVLFDSWFATPKGIMDENEQESVAKNVLDVARHEINQNHITIFCIMAATMILCTVAEMLLSIEWDAQQLSMTANIPFTAQIPGLVLIVYSVIGAVQGKKIKEYLAAGISLLLIPFVVIMGAYLVLGIITG